MAEGCTHHRKDDDIGTVKIPNLIKRKQVRQLNFHHVSGFLSKRIYQSIAWLFIVAHVCSIKGNGIQADAFI